MKIQKKDLAKSQVELTVEISVQEFKPYIEQGAEKVSREVKIDGFRPGKAPYEVLKGKIGEMTILEEAARIAINKTLEKAIKDNIDGQPVGQPEVNITKIAPNNPMEYKIVLALLPEVKIGNYKNLKIKQEEVKTKDEEVEKMIDQLRDMKVKESIVNREIKTGDKAVVNIEMFLDKVPVEGGQSKDTAVVIGKGYIIPGFDKKLIGAKKDDVREFELSYPKDHHQANLAGKLVEFRVRVKEVSQRELPEVNDEFVKNFGLKKVSEFRENIKKSLDNEKHQQAEQKAELAMLDKITEKTKFSDIPETLINHEARVMMAELEENVNRQGGKFDDYLNHLNKTRDKIMLELLPNAVKRVKTSLLIQEIAKAEKVAVTEEEVDQQVKEMNKHYQGQDKQMLDKINSPEYRHYLFSTIAGRKVINKLREWNIEKK